MMRLLSNSPWGQRPVSLHGALEGYDWIPTSQNSLILQVIFGRNLQNHVDPRSKFLLQTKLSYVQPFIATRFQVLLLFASGNLSKQS